MPTDTTERGLEERVCRLLTGASCEPGSAAADRVEERPAAYGPGWSCGFAEDYDREFCVDLPQLRAFLRETQPETAAALGLDEDGPARRKFLKRLADEVEKRGTIHLLRHGLSDYPHKIELFFGTPSPGNPKAQERHRANRFTVTRQLRYSRKDKRNALDLALFLNGLPVLTVELKNSLTKQDAADAVEQYRRDRDPKERLFRAGRCVAHFAVDERQVRFCTDLRGKASWFLPFNRGRGGGAGNPPNPDGLATDYLWREVLTRESLTDILENYAQVVETTGPAGKRQRECRWPRYHQLEVVRKLLAEVRQRGVGGRYLIQHSAGSGKSLSIAWLVRRLIELGGAGGAVFDSIVVVTDRTILDRQTHETILQVTDIPSTLGHADRSATLRRFIESGKKVIVSTVQKFPWILDEIGDRHAGRRFAIVIDEAHSSQGGKTASAMSQALGGDAGDDAGDDEDRINRIMKSRKPLANASYFAFTATPKNRTLEVFGAPDPQPDGRVRHRPFHTYSMRQAIEERFIVDVLRHYTPVSSYYQLVKKIEADPEFDSRGAMEKLRRYVEDHDHAIRIKAEIMVDDFDRRVLTPCLVGGKARAMVVVDSVDQAIGYFRAITAILRKSPRKSPWRAIVAFSGKHESESGETVSELSLNGFGDDAIRQKFREDPFRFLVCADKFQTGYDEPLLQTMYVDKTLSGVQAVQTLSRLNRAHSEKSSAFVLDFKNDADAIRRAFEPYYRTTILSDETDPNRLHDLKAALDGHPVYTQEQVEELVRRWLAEEERGRLDPILDAGVEAYRAELDEDAQVDFKGKAKAFLRAYAFLAQILPVGNAAWERLSIFLEFLVPRLPAPVEEDLSKGILESIDMDSYRAEKQAIQRILLSEDAPEIDPAAVEGGGGKPEPEFDLLSVILSEFNDLFGDIQWADEDRVRRLITKDIPQGVSADAAYGNALRQGDPQNARIEHDAALNKVMTELMQDDAELFRQFSDNDSFHDWLARHNFELTSRRKNAA